MTDSPYTLSRARVLERYRDLRRKGAIPSQAMQAVLIQAHRTLAGFPTAREEAEAEWDREHARRYLGIIDQHCARLDMTGTYWRTGGYGTWALTRA